MAEKNILKDLLLEVLKSGASDLHLSAGEKPRLRILGSIQKIDSFDQLNSKEIRNLCYSLLSEKQQAAFEEEKNLDFSFGVKDLARFRVSIFYQKGQVSAVFRIIPHEIPNREFLGLPPTIDNFIDFPNGLVLITGPTGSGKTTTLATLINKINNEQKKHIVTVEDPIEFFHFSKKSIVTQRELESDVFSFPKALKYALRQDPDVCLIGELRDLDTIEMALKLADTGHLVFATLHSSGAVDSIMRLIDSFPGSYQNRVRMQLSFVLRAVMSQRLILNSFGNHVLASEMLFMNDAIKNLVRENQLHQIYSSMQLGQKESRMYTMNQSLMLLVQRGKLDMQSALHYSSNRKELQQLLLKKVA